jgi:predicted metal-dependent enzyme (double-stranded beta helix superfamily)
LECGCVVPVSPTIGNVHAIANAFVDRVSISIHPMAAKSARSEGSLFDVRPGNRFVSSYDNAGVFNSWNLEGRVKWRDPYSALAERAQSRV